MFSMMSNDIGIDLGTASILVYIKGKGVVLKEPSVVAIDRDTNKIMAIGEEARLMIGRTPGNLTGACLVGCILYCLFLYLSRAAGNTYADAGLP